MTNWFYKVGDLEAGPVAFEELARLLREGALDETVPVRREGSDAWAHAWTVPMLAAALERAKTPPVEAPPTDAAATGSRTTSATAAAREQERKSETRAGSLTTSATALLPWMVPAAAGSLAVLVAYWAACRGMRFPPSRLHGGATGDYYFVFVGRCEAWECALLYFDVFSIAAALGWWLWDRIGRR